MTTGYHAAHDDGLAPSRSTANGTELFVHDCGKWPHPQILAQGETCQHCGQVAGHYIAGMTLIAGGEHGRK